MAYSIEVNLPYEKKASRVALFARFLVVMAFCFPMMFWMIPVYVALFIQWWVILFTGKKSEKLYRFLSHIFVFCIKLDAYYYLLTDQIPSGEGECDPKTKFPLTMDFKFKAPDSRLQLFLRAITMFWYSLVLGVWGIWAMIILFLQWWCILFTARRNESFNRYLLNYFKFDVRVSAYLMLFDWKMPSLGKDK